MRDVVVLLAMLVFVPLALRHTFVAYLLWGWTGLIALNFYLYGFMIPLPYVQIFALIALGSWFWTKDAERHPFQPNRTMILLFVFWVHTLLSALFAYPGLNQNWSIFSNLSKTLLFCALMPMIVTSRFRIHAVVLMIVMATAFHGALDGLKFLASAGAHTARGLAKFGDNNQFALVLVMVLPLIYYLYQYSARRWVRISFAATGLLTVLAIVATSSRGGFAGVAAVAIWIILQSRRKFVGIVVVVLAGVMVLQLAPESWRSRMDTIKTVEEDSSFMGRVAAWKVSSAIALAHPVLGGGIRVIEDATTWERFKSSPSLLDFVETPQVNGFKAAHSMWFEVMGDQGFVGVFLFVALLTNAFFTRRDIRAIAKRGGGTDKWATDLTDMVVASLFAYMVAGSLLSVAYFETPYMLIILMEVIKQVLLQSAEPVPAVGRGVHA